jgi:hypothetical protein
MPRDHISDFESVGGRVLCGGTGSDSGELYSRLNDDVREELDHGGVEELTFPYSQSSRGGFAACHGKFQSRRASHVGCRVVSMMNNGE